MLLKVLGGGIVNAKSALSQVDGVHDQGHNELLHVEGQKPHCARELGPRQLRTCPIRRAPLRGPSPTW